MPTKGPHGGRELIPALHVVEERWHAELLKEAREAGRRCTLSDDYHREQLAKARPPRKGSQWDTEQM